MYVCMFGCMQVCREFLRGRCTRDAESCRFAHPEKQVSVGADNTVTPCMDFINNKCTREPCRYFHAPAHLKAVVRSSGRGGGGGPRVSSLGEGKPNPSIWIRAISAVNVTLN